VSQLAAFLGVSALVIVTPGQDTALTIRNTLLGGRRAGIFTAVGVSAGQAGWTLAASAGIAALLVASEPAFVAVKLAGAAYLVFLGAQALWSAIVGHGRRHSVREGSSRSLEPRLAFRQGLVSNLGNPKMAVFFTSLLPQFAGSGAGFRGLARPGGALRRPDGRVLSAYAVAVDRASRVLGRPLVRRALDAVTGVVLVALGLRLATEPPTSWRRSPR
jgi:threonine/homoserine/homoserine lactone efflux protein